MSERIGVQETRSEVDTHSEQKSISPENLAIIRENLAKYGKEWDSLVERGLAPAYLVEKIRAVARGVQ